MIHGPSLGLGAAIAAVAIIASFMVFGMTSTEQELQIRPAPLAESELATRSLFFDNGSPVLGNPDAPVTIV